MRAKGKDDTQTEAIYAQVTKRAKKSEIKISMRPEIPILHIGSNKQPLKADSQEGNADHCQSGEFVFSEIMPKNGLLHNQTLSCQKEAEECTDGPALPARGEQTDLLERPPPELTESVNESNTVLLRENKSLITNETDSQKAAIIGNGEIMKDKLQASSPERGDQTCGKTDITSHDPDCSDKVSAVDSELVAADLSSQNDENLPQHNDTDEEKHCHIAQKAPTPAGTPTTPDWDPSTDVSLITPTDSGLSPMTSNSADCLTPSDSWMSSGGGGVGNGGWRALGNETPHRDSAYFSDSDWEGDGLNRRSSDGLITPRQSSGRGGDRGTLTGIEENTEEEGEMGEKSPLKNSIQMSEKTTIESVLGSNDPETAVSHLDDESLKGLPHSGEYPIDNHFTGGIIAQIADSAENDLNLHSKTIAEANVLIESVSDSQSKDCVLRPNNNDYTCATEMDIDLTALNSLKRGNDTEESVPPTQSDNRESRLSKLYGVQTTDAALSDEPLSVVEPSDDGKSVYDEVSGLMCPSWAEAGAEEAERREERPGLDHNELGLRNLRCLDGSEDKKVTTETEKQLAAAELSNAMKEKSPLRGTASRMELS
ncbi:hypothetical protein D9C73_016260 [Collichthys lucidus]|uniref:Uncharacterized protein n=1 Tax=Collichthys lucidus TaxID=240159 RepID=A0A4U5V4I3_COLLU|nr:hypothetical protein D9C73_016260 [Collichthys lucidus]